MALGRAALGSEAGCMLDVAASVTLTAIDVASAAPFIRAVEALGFESYWMGDHAAVPHDLESYPYTASGRPSFPQDAQFADVLVLFAHLAAVTTSLRLGTGIFVLPMRNPLLVARAATTVDILSGGRLLLGVGVGWCAEEFELLGQRFEDRGQRMDEAIRILRRVGAPGPFEFHGAHYEIPPLEFEPKPVQRPFPPILVGGESPAALRRAALLGDGWYPANIEPDPDVVRTTIVRLRALRAQAGREAEPFSITVPSTPVFDRDWCVAMVEAGVTRIVVRVPDMSPGSIAMLARFADDATAALTP